MTERPDGRSNTPEAGCRLARAWRLKGKLDRAEAALLDILKSSPRFVPAYFEMASLMLQLGRAEEAVAYYETALEMEPASASIKIRYKFLKDLLEKPSKPDPPSFSTPWQEGSGVLEDHPDGRIDLSGQKTFRFHRSGWDFALHALRPLHNSRGVQFDGFIENNFAWKHRQEGKRPAPVLERMRREGTFEVLATSEEKGITPYTRSWVGVFHNPHEMPAWFHPQESPQAIMARDIWKKSLPSCLGLFTLSEHHARWLREQTGKPVSVLFHPTEIPAVRFDFEAFLDNSDKKIVQIGWWLRRLTGIYALPIPADNPIGYRKIRLVPMFFPNASVYLEERMDKERHILGVEIEPRFSENTREIPHLPDEEYDDLLSRNIAFLDLHDANANNVIVECLARATPLLVNPLPAVVEYLGADYPLYFRTLKEAASKALNTGLLREAHEYLKSVPTREKLGGDYFLRSFRDSQVYRSL